MTVDLIVLSGAIMIGVAVYGFMTVRHVVKLIAYFILATAGLVLLASSFTGPPTALLFLFLILASTEEAVGLTLAVLYYRRTGTTLLRERGD
jgi:NADH:ubiquinone oxidoreductase subunit K